MPPPRDADTIRVLIATDSHVGYCERDPIRKDDSSRSFNEVMELAKSEDVDMVLLAGDLFHDNKPSRKSMYQVMRSLRKNCLGDKPCELEFLSDASTVFEGAFNNVNYEDPDINVAIPVFSIHGNHDDPTGDGHYCSLDLLQASGFVNYFGRIPETDKIEVKPVLLQKGNTKLALFGISSVRDERLFRTFRDGKVKFFRPRMQQDDWFNLMAVHQNHTAHNETGYLPENVLPDYMDLVIWGHEHECLIDPRLNPETMFHVMQPGSSVATSLIPAEAVTKHVAVVEVNGKNFVMKKHRLKTVRPFIYREIVLANEARFKKLAKEKDNRTALTAELMKVVDELIEEAKAEWLESQGDEAEEINEEDIPRPLIRLKVEATAPEGGKFDTENPQRFSNRFSDRVANVNDVITFYKKKVVTRRNKNDTDMPEESVLAAMAGIDNMKVEKFVREYLAAQSLKVLPQALFGDAIKQFVDKQDHHAMEYFVRDSLAGQMQELMSRGADEEGDMDGIMEEHRAKMDDAFKAAGGVSTKPKKTRGKLLPRRRSWDSDVDGEWGDNASAYGSPDDDEVRAKPVSRRGKPVLKGSDDDASVVSAPATKTRKAPAKKAPAKSRAPAKAPAKATGRGKKKVPEPSDDEDDDLVMMDAPPPPKSMPKRAAATKGRQSTINFSQSQAKPSTARELSDDEISDEDDAFEPAVSSSRRR
ncbi:Double-strand break repair protein [Lachnellula subtilissima]|uniref:Double-strand break repair protein n=1 Tax=Lachnellula subtilissima TaxID=602034 RepID=A0A8H8RVF3_9HELO|nr:Double-strand break repair protein [Lachnellula subtilissima]